MSRIIRKETVYRTSQIDGRTIESKAPVVRCNCGLEVLCDKFTNTCECGADYNGSGDLLAPREQWGEETGESVTDILMADSDPWGEKSINMNTELINKAKDFALKAHSSTNHFYDKNKPYETHLKMVVIVAAFFSHLLAPEERELAIAGAWAHDTIEDTRNTYNDVKSALSQEVAEIVFALTNEKGRTRKERANKKYYDGIKENKIAWFVKICDRIANVEYSYFKKSKMFEMYKNEYSSFKEELYNEEYKEMFSYLESIFSEENLRLMFNDKMEYVT